MPRLKINTAATKLPVTVGQAVNWLKLEDGHNEDAVLKLLIESATDLVQDYTARSLVSETWDLWMDDFPLYKRESYWDGVREGALRDLFGQSGEIVIPRSPLVSVTHLKTYSDDDTESTFSSSNYRIDTVSAPPRLRLLENQSWPTELRNVNAINIQFVAGYGTPDLVPAKLKAAVLETVAYFYEHRGDERESTTLPKEAKVLCDPLKVWSIS